MTKGICNKNRVYGYIPYPKKETDLATLGKWKVTKSSSQKYISRKLHSCP